MSNENVEVLRRGFEAINGGDIDRILEFIHPEFEAEIPPELSAEPDTYRGHEGIRRYFQTFEDAMDEIHFEPERFWDAEDRVVAVVRVSAKGRETGIAVEQLTAQLWTIRDGKAAGVRAYASLAEALDAAGLQGQSRQPS
jgi:ketosteroid isomerase-like protein